MARPIAETPIITGDDARRFDEAMANLKPASRKEIKAQKKDYDWFKSIASFPLP
jgi:hypothetical protein